jgi:hypothetical protein
LNLDYDNFVESIISDMPIIAFIGGSDFMTHIRQKFTFGTVTFFSRYFGLFELFCGQSLLLVLTSKKINSFDSLIFLR